jgi:hypothetical protein
MQHKLRRMMECKYLGLTPAVVALVAMAIAGCVPSWNGLYTEKDLVLEPKLVGTWKGDDGKEKWVFEKQDEKTYRLIHTDGEKQEGKFEARLLKLGKHRFLDLYVTQVSQDDLKCNAIAKMMLVPAHLFFRVDEIGDKIKLAAVNPDKVKEHLTKDPKAIAHRKVDDSVIFTADTPQLQAYVIKYADGDALFGDVFTLDRE